MKVRIVDYVANLGGGVRFTVEMVRALGRSSGLSFEVVSHGDALERYRSLLPAVVPVSFLDLPPRKAWRQTTLMAGIPGAGPLNWLLGTPDFAFAVPPAAIDDCDVAWFPWVHRHRIPRPASQRILGSLHDVIILDFPGWFPPAWAASERATLQGWLDSEARIAVSSQATAASLGRLFGASPGRVSVIPLAGQHGAQPSAGDARRWAFSGRDYLLCPANLSRHKNHETLIAAVGSVAARHPLVLTGEGTDVYASRTERRLEVQLLVNQAGLVPGETIFPVGYVDDPAYSQILDGAWALVMPTFAEGGGSFPVWEAMERGIPVVASDIPVMREMVERIGGEVLWFDPQSADSLARVLADLEADYDRVRASAQGQVRTLRRRTWADVAAGYATLMRLPAGAAEGGGDA